MDTYFDTIRRRMLCHPKRTLRLKPRLRIESNNRLVLISDKHI